MRIVLRLLAALLILLAVVIGLERVASESGEVVVLTTRSPTGEAQTTRLWIVESDGQPYLRAGMAQAGWYQRLLANPNVRVLRGDTERSYVAKPELARVDEINALMSEKYGWADAYIGFLFGREDAVPVRLDAS